MHLAGLAQSSSGPRAGSCPPLRGQMAGQHPPAPWHWDHTPSHPLSTRKGHIGAALGQNQVLPRVTQGGLTCVQQKPCPVPPSLPRQPSGDHMPTSPTPATKQSHRRPVSAGWNTAPGSFRAGSNPSPGTSHDGSVPWSRLDCARGPGGLRETLACPLRDEGQEASVSTSSTCCPELSKARAWAEVTQPTGPLLPNRLISGAGPQDGVRVRQPGMWPHQRGGTGELTEAIPCMWQLRGQLRQKLSPGRGAGCAALRARCPQPPGPRDTCPESLGSSYRCGLDHSLSSLHPHWAAQQLVLRVQPGPSHGVSSSGPGY